jgi:FkbM family methyltransferase
LSGDRNPERGLGRSHGGRRIEATGVIHVGGHHGEEAEYYAAQGVEKVLWIEAEPDAYEILCAHTAQFEGHLPVQALVTNEDGARRPFYRHRFHSDASKRGFCSTLPWNPEVVQDDRVLSRLKTFDVATMTSTTLPSLLEHHSLTAADYQYLSLNVQGAELMVLQGMGATLDSIACVFCDGELDPRGVRYLGAPTIGEVADWLSERGFTAVGEQLTRQQLFIRC